MRSTSHTFIFKALQLKLVFCDENKLKIVRHTRMSPSSWQGTKTECDLSLAREAPACPQHLGSLSSSNADSTAPDSPCTLSAKCWMMKDALDILGFSKKEFLLTKLLYSF